MSSSSDSEDSNHQDFIPSSVILSSLIGDGVTAKDVFKALAPGLPVPTNLRPTDLWSLIQAITEPPRRKKLPQYNTIDDAVKLISRSKNIVVLSGAGISTSAGIPDFRSRDGLYKQISAQYPDLPSPSSMFDINFFRSNPLPFFHIARTLFPGQFAPTLSHQFVKCIEEHGKLLRNYTQNIDTLEKQAGIERVLECHGSFDKATCTSCKFTVDGLSIKAEIEARKVPLCPTCHTNPEGPKDGLGIMKPNIVFFGEQLGSEFHNALEADKPKIDLLIVIGSSLKVRPVALIPRAISNEIPQILINREPLDGSFDIELLGDSDEILQEICLRLGGDWMKICKPGSKLLTELVGFSQPVASSSQEATSTASECSSSRYKLNQPSSSSSTDLSIQHSSSEKAKSVPKTEDKDTPETIDLCSSKSESSEVAIDESDESSDEEDYQDTESDYSVSRIEMKHRIPNSAFVYVKPSTYLFKSAELSMPVYEKYLIRSHKDE